MICNICDYPIFNDEGFINGKFNMHYKCDFVCRHKGCNQKFFPFNVFPYCDDHIDKHTIICDYCRLRSFEYKCQNCHRLNKRFF